SRGFPGVSMTSRKTRERINDLLVGNLMEVGIIETDRAKALIILQADDLISLLAHLRERFGRSDGHRQDELRRIAHSDCPQRRARGRTGRNAIVDDDRDTMSNVGPFAVAQIAP